MYILKMYSLHYIDIKKYVYSENVFTTLYIKIKYK